MKPKVRECPTAKVECRYLACAKGVCARKTPPPLFKRPVKTEPRPGPVGPAPKPKGEKK